MTAIRQVSKPFRARPRTDVRPRFQHPVPCKRCSGSRYVGADYCLACDGWGEVEGPPPATRAPLPARPLAPAEVELVASFIGLANAYDAFQGAIGRAIAATRAAQTAGVAQGGMLHALEQVRLAAGGAGLSDHIKRFKWWADARDARAKAGP